jgi:hypothetical protein
MIFGWVQEAQATSGSGSSCPNELQARRGGPHLSKTNRTPLFSSLLPLSTLTYRSYPCR